MDHVGLRVLCQFWVLVLVNVFSQVGTGVCFFSNFLLFRIICVRYLIAIWEKDSINIWILELGICRSLVEFNSCCMYSAS